MNPCLRCRYWRGCLERDRWILCRSFRPWQEKKEKEEAEADDA